MLSYRSDAQSVTVRPGDESSLLQRAEKTAPAWIANITGLVTTTLCAIYIVKSVGHFVCGATSHYRVPDPHTIEMALACGNPAVRVELGERCHHFEWLGSSVGFLYAGLVEVQEHTYTCGVINCSSLVPDGLGPTLFAVSVTLIVVALCMFRCASGAGQRQYYVEDPYRSRQSVRISEIHSGTSGSSSDEYVRERRKIAM